nr:RDD family protein [Pyrinomonadaceae bacterium]
ALGLGLYNKVFLVNKRGFSIGQGIMKLKVVDAMGNIPSIGTLILRLLVQLGMNAIPFVGVILVLLDLLWPLWDEKKQTLHDKAASTFVIKTA